MIFTKTSVMMLINRLIQVTLMLMIIDPCQKVKIKNVIGKFKDELGGKIMSEFCALKAKTYAFKPGNGSEVKKS